MTPTVWKSKRRWIILDWIEATFLRWWPQKGVVVGNFLYIFSKLNSINRHKHTPRKGYTASGRFLVFDPEFKISWRSRYDCKYFSNRNNFALKHYIFLVCTVYHNQCIQHKLNCFWLQFDKLFFFVSHVACRYADRTFRPQGHLILCIPSLGLTVLFMRVHR